MTKNKKQQKEFRERKSHISLGRLTGYALLAGALALTGFKYAFNYSSRNKTSLPRTSEFSKNSESQPAVDYRRQLPLLIVEGTRNKWSVTEEQHKTNLEHMLERVPFGSNITDIKLIEAYKEILVRIEPDRVYANNLIKPASKSIEHMVEFLSSPYIQKPRVRFEIPENINQIRIENIEDVLIYVVAGIGERAVVKYSIMLNGKKKTYVLEFMSKSDGESTYWLTMGVKETGFQVIKEKETPLFYSTSASEIELIETPAIEVLHKCVKPYTRKHMDEEFKDATRTKAGMMAVMDKHIYREERFVHALSILWLREYNIDTSLGFTEKQLNRRFQKYENKEYYQYNGTLELSRHIAQIGIREAIEQYVHAPEKLFIAGRTN